jgi:ABC-2 type transport system permease protein
MIAALKAEFRKIFSVRSTYFILVIVFLLLVLFAFYIGGYRIDTSDLHNPTTLANDVTGAVSTVAIFIALISVLLVTHEYRYNTIMYTFISAKSRSKVLLAKILVISIFAIVLTFLVGALSPLFTLLGIHAHHLKLAHQSLHYGNLLWRDLFFGWGYAMAGLLLATLIRNQVGTIIVLFVAPGTVEGLLGLLLKKNVVYLPFSALHVVIGQGLNYNNSITAVHAAEVFGAYLLAGWLVAWFLFIKRDAN